MKTCNHFFQGSADFFKTTFPIFLYLIFCFATANAQAPEVDFNKYYWAVNKPGGGTMTAATSGEDWFYDLKQVFEDGKPYGYIGAGYSSIPNFYLDDGCQPRELDTVAGDGNGDNFQMAVPNPHGWPNWHGGPVFPKLGFANSQGKQTWYNLYGYANGNYGNGVFYNVIQTPDGGYLAVGRLTIGNGMNYNPTPGTPAGLPFACELADTTTGAQQGYIVKTDIDGNLQWHYLYGFESTVNNAMLSSSVLYQVIPYTGGNYLVLGRSQVISTGNKHITLFVINSSGVIQSKTRITTPIQGVFTENGHSGRRIITSGTNIFISGMLFKDMPANVGNNEGKAVAMVLKLNSSFTVTGSFLVESGLADVPAGWNPSILLAHDNIAYDLEDDGARLVSGFIVDDPCGGCGENFKDQGIGKVYSINPSTMAGVELANIGIIKAFDLAIDVILPVPPDGGYIVASTKQTSPQINCTHPYTPNYCVNPLVFCRTFETCGTHSRGYNKSNWATDCYVAKYNASNFVEWNKTITESTPPANWGTYDYGNPPVNQGYVGNPTLQGDLKRQECFYRIIRTSPDNGLAICGNNSNNMDDDVIIKLHSNCQKLQTYDINANQTISTPVSWPSSRKVNAEITVASGGTLTITGASTVIQFSDTRQVGKPVRIVVQQGGRLIINNGAKLTGVLACPNSTWEGVMVLGNFNQPQSPESNQGVVEITSASIENARNAITAGAMLYTINAQGNTDYTLEMTPLNGLFGGGIIKATTANFTNNRTAVRILPYIFFPSPGVESANASFFTTCNFKVDNNMNGYFGLEQFMFLNVITGLNIRGCKFENNKTNLTEIEELGTGIYSIDAGYTVNRYCISADCALNTRGNFKNLLYGVRATRISSSRTFTVDRTDLTNNIFGVKSEGVNNFSVIRNAFTVGNNPVPAPTNNPSNSGVFVETGIGFIIEENTFTKPATTTISPIGVAISNTGANANQVYKNTYTQMATANMSTLQNRNSSGTIGLQFLCNTYVNTTALDQSHNTALVPLEGIKTAQGAMGAPAGNKFSTTASFNIFMFGATNVVNYHYGTGANENPAVIANAIETATGIASSCPTHLIDGGGFALPGNEFRNNFYRNRNLWQDEQTAYESGNTGLKNEGESSSVENTLLDRMDYYHEMNFAAYSVISEILNNSKAGIDHAELREWLANLNSLTADYAIVEDYFSMGDVDAALKFVSELENSQAMDETEAATHGELMTLYHLQADLMRSNKNWDGMNSDQLEQVKLLADNPLPQAASIKAQNILRGYYGAKYDRYPVLPQFQLALSQPVSIPAQSNEGLSVYPNPSDGFVIFDYKADLSPNAALIITNSIGQVIQQVSLSEGTGQKLLNTSSLKTGVYYYRLNNPGFKQLTGKFTVIH